MMKIRWFIFTALMGILAVSCGFDKRDTGRVYMPDMAYSRAYETYADHHELADSGIFYNNMPVTGTVSRSQDYIYHLEKDKAGDTANYASSHTVENPVKSLSEAELKETERLYLINCAICHGDKLDGNGPLWKDGNGPFPAAPKNLKTLVMADGTMYYSITYGRNLMGSYASQLTPKQRWDIIYYIRTKQGGGTTQAAAATDTTATPKK